LDALKEYADSTPAESAAKAQGFAKVIGHGNFLVSLKCAVAVLDHLENLNRAVQSSSKSVVSMVTAMKMTVGALNDFRDEDRFQALFEKAVMLCRESDVPFPELPWPTAKTRTQATLSPSTSTRLDNSRKILSQSVISGCGHYSHPCS